MSSVRKLGSKLDQCFKIKSAESVCPAHSAHLLLPDSCLSLEQMVAEFNVRLNSKNLRGQTTNIIKAGVWVRNKIFAETIR